MCHPCPSSPNGVQRTALLRRSLRHLPCGSAAHFSLRPPFPECFASWLLSAHPSDLGNLQSRSGRKRPEPPNVPWGTSTGGATTTSQDNLYHDAVASFVSCWEA